MTSSLFAKSFILTKNVYIYLKIAVLFGAEPEVSIFKKIKSIHWDDIAAKIIFNIELLL